MTHDYDDIIDLPHHVSKTHPRMSMQARAAQFAPFAALTGYESLLREAARATETHAELAADSLDALNRKMGEIMQRIDEKPQVMITYFLPDDRKEGGAYRQVTGRVRKIREFEQLLELQTDEGIVIIPFNYIVDIT